MNLRSSLWPPATILTLVVLIGGPMHLRMPTWPDADVFDMMAKTVFQGGVAYRDLATNSLPGMAWAQMPVRAAFGWSMFALRAVDLALFGLSVWLLVDWPEDRNRVRQLWRAIPLVLSYFAVTEFVHCQRDVWMLLPIMAAVHVHGWSPASWRSELGRGLLAGLLWGTAVWIKPHAVIPAIAVWTCASIGRPWKRIAIDGAGALAGLVVGAAGVAWLVGTGAWPDFAEHFFVWNREYLEHWRAPPLARLQVLARMLYPWNLVHLAAIPLSLWSLFRPPVPSLRLLAALYLGWLIQAAALQAFYDYNYYVPVLLGWAVVVRWADFRGLVRAAAIGGVLALALVHPMFRPERISAWPSCWLSGRDAELQDRLALYHVIDSVDLEAVEEYLRSQHPDNGEVLSYDWRTSRIYLDLDLKPPMAQMTLFDVVLMWPGRYYGLLDELAKSRVKYVVVDLKLDVLLFEDLKSSDLELPPSFPKEFRGDFPWSLPMVFRRGRYSVHRALGPCGWLTPNPPPPGKYEKVHGLLAFRKGPRIGIAERDGELVLFESLHQREPMHWWQPRYRVTTLTKREQTLAQEAADLWRQYGPSMEDLAMFSEEAAAQRERFVELNAELGRSLKERKAEPAIVDAYFRRGDGPDLGADVPVLAVRWTPAGG